MVNCVVTELEEAYEVFKNKQGVLTANLPLVSSNLGIPVTNPETTIRDATGLSHFHHNLPNVWKLEIL